jgi:hypothetical protein
MTKRGLASFVATAALLIARAAGAQPQYTAPTDAPQWLKDRRYNEGIGIRSGDLEVHPGIAGEVGYDSNWFQRSTDTNVANGPPAAPVVPSFVVRVTPSLYLSTISRQRREGDVVAASPAAVFRAGVNATYRALFGLSSDASQKANDPSQGNTVSGAADLRLDILPERPVGGAIFGGFTRIVQPNTTTADPNVSFTRDDIRAGAEVAIQPGGGTLDWRLGYEFDDLLFEYSSGVAFDNMTHQVFTRGRWKFRPRTSLVYDGSLRFISYGNDQQAVNAAALVSSTPARARIGINGLVTDRFAALAMVGWGATFLDTSQLPAQKQYDSVIGQAELKWFLSASPGVASATELGLALSSIAVGYTRDFQLSYLGNFYGTDRGYLKFYYFFAGRALATLEGGVGAIEYPTLLNPPGAIGPAVRHGSFTDTRADATLFSEYRFTDAFGINATLRYTQNFSKQQIPLIGTPGSLYAMAWQRFEAYLGVRFFM